MLRKSDERHAVEVGSSACVSAERCLRASGCHWVYRMAAQPREMSQSKRERIAESLLILLKSSGSLP